MVKLDKVRGLDITINTTASNDEQALLLLKSLNFPINDYVRIWLKKVR